MAPLGNSYKGDFTAQELKSVQLPKSFPCSTCKLHRDPLMFAKRYHNDYRFRKVSNRGFIPTASNTKYNCRDCATIQPNKLMCEGQCGLSKPLDHFSKTQRSNGERWCKECVLWKTSQEPGGVVEAGPGQDLAPDEDPAIYGQYAYYDPGEGEDEDDYESSIVLTGSDQDWEKRPDIAFSMAGLGINGTRTVNSGHTGLPHLHGLVNRSAAPSNPLNGAPSTTAASTTTSGDYLPPHLRGQPAYNDDMGSSSSVSNRYEGRESIVSSRFSTIEQPIRFTGYDPYGQAHVQYRLPSRSTTVTHPGSDLVSRASCIGPAGRSVLSTTRPDNRPDNWPSQAISAADVTPAITTRGNWAVPQGRRTVNLPAEQRYQPARRSNFPRRSAKAYDSDGSQDEM